MITKENIQSFLQDSFKQSDYFLVDVQVSANLDVHVFFDAPKGISITDCKKVNRMILETFDRDQQDYALNVSSPGLDQPFKVFDQYKKCLNKTIKIKTTDNLTLKGDLTTLDDKAVTLRFEEVKKVGKKKIKEEKEVAIPFASIVEAKSVISFKKNK